MGLFHSDGNYFMMRPFSYSEARKNSTPFAVGAGRWAPGFLISLLLWVSPAGAFDPYASGRLIYHAQCVECHGGMGEGVADKFDEPLYGDRNLDSLTRLIERTMPEEEPELCVGDEARDVAEFVYHSFYSPAARERIRPPRIELSRLTVAQFENSVADLIAAFRKGPKWDERRGLAAEYFDARGSNNDKKILERIDPQIVFQFGEGKPLAEVTGAEEFSMRWRGSIFVEETGDYQFRLRTENGARLWVNNDSTLLIDAWVSSGNMPRDEEATIRLLGGRAYPIQVAFFKFKEKTASIELQWRPPHQAWTPVPESVLSPVRVAETLVIQTPFPPDDSSSGYERGIAVSRAWDQAVTHAAVEVADYVLQHANRLAGVAAKAEDRPEDLKTFALQFVERAFRRPLSSDQRALYVDRSFEETPDPEKALQRVVLMTLKAPWFLYPDLGPDPADEYQFASRLALAVWDSLPDNELWQLANNGKLRSPEILHVQAQRLVADPRARTKLRGFFHHWLELEEADDISKDPKAFPEFNDEFLSDLRTSLYLFLDGVVWDGTSDYRELLLADYLYLNRRLADFYGFDWNPSTTEVAATDSDLNPESQSQPEPQPEPETPAKVDITDREFRKVSVSSAERVGVVTHPFLLSTFAYYKNSSPIHRGVFLSRNVLGRALRPPPMAIEFMDGRFDPSLTMREKVAELTGSAACQTCHAIINPLGFSLEHYDAVGRYRTVDNKKPVDASGDYPLSEGGAMSLTGARDVAVHAASSEEAQRGFIRQLFQHLTKQSPLAYGPVTLDHLGQRFVHSEFHIQKLLVDMALLATRQGLIDDLPAQQPQQHSAR